jgi:hypothetical protein
LPLAQGNGKGQCLTMAWATLAMGWTGNNTKHGVNGNGEYLVVKGINQHKGSLLTTYKAMATRVIHHQNIKMSTNNAKEQYKWTTTRGFIWVPRD